MRILSKAIGYLWVYRGDVPGINVYNLVETDHHILKINKNIHALLCYNIIQGL